MIQSLGPSQVSSTTIPKSSTPSSSHASSSSVSAGTKYAVDEMISMQYAKFHHAQPSPSKATDTTIQQPKPDSPNNNIFKRIRKWIITDPSRDYSPDNAKYNYQHFRASNLVFLFGGRLKTTRHSPLLKFTTLQLPMSIILMIVPFVIYLVFEASWLWHDVSPAIVICFIYVFLLMLTNHLKAAFLDPGILPRNIHLVDNLEQDALPENYHSILELPGPTNQKTGEAKPVYLKYCTSCYIWRPIRSSHCSRCNACVANLDHHCPWLGVCVGQRNYWYFLNFLIFENLTCVYLCCTSFYHLGKVGLQHTKLSLFLGIYSVVVFSYPALLLFYHFCLGLTGITTREYLNAERHEGNLYLQDVCLNPFNSRKYGFNLKRQWFRPKGRSNFPMLDKYEVGDHRFKTVQIGAV